MSGLVIVQLLTTPGKKCRNARPDPITFYAGIRAEIPPWGAVEMRQMALYLMWRGEGLPIEVPAVRK